MAERGTDQRRKGGHRGASHGGEASAPDRPGKPVERADAAGGTPHPHAPLHHGVADRLGFFLFLAMVVLCPLPEGSTDDAWISIWLGTSAAAVLLASYRNLNRGAGLLIFGLLLVLLGYGAVATLQSVSPGPLPLPLWAQASALLGEDLPALSGLVRDSPVLFLSRPLLAALVLTAGILYGAERYRAQMLSLAVVGAACLYGAIGTVALVFSISALRPFDQGGSLTAFFINKNTTATYLGTALLIAVALLAGPVRTRLRERGSLLAWSGEKGDRKVNALTGAALFLLVLLPLTKSRAGLILTLLLAAAPAVYLLRGRIRNRWMIAVGVLGTFAVVYALSGESWRVRQADVGFDSLGRLDAYLAQIRAIADHPWLGLGLGSFADAFPQFRPTEMGIVGQLNIGHSTPLELAFEGGLPLVLLVGSYVVLCALVLVYGLLRRRHDPFILAAVLVGVLGMAHSSIDFSLQIPGYLILYLAVVGMGLRRALMPEEMVVVRRRVRSAPEAAKAEQLLSAFRAGEPAPTPATPPAPPPPA